VIGRIIDNYEIRSLLGEGDVGAVYLCEHTFITRRVAVKVLRRPFCQDEAKVARFMSDARAVNNLGHPEIAHIVDMGRLSPDVGQIEDDGAGLPYVMREWVDGETLAQRIGRAGRVPLYEATAIAKQACAALIATHGAGIVHGDLKPENFLLGDALRGARLKLLDFGVVHLRDGGAAPDMREDVRALGAILQAMLAGPSPNPDLPRWMERIIERAAGLEPETPFETMSALAAALDDGPHVRVTAEARAAVAAAPSGEGVPAMDPAPLPGMTAASPPAMSLDPALGAAADPQAAPEASLDAGASGSGTITPRVWVDADADDPRASMITPPPAAIAPAPMFAAVAPAALTNGAAWPPAPAAPQTTATRATPTRPRKTLEELRRTLQQASSRRDTPAYPFLVPSPPPTPLPDPRAGKPFSQMLAPRRSRLKMVVGAAALLGAGYLWAPWSPRNRTQNLPPPVATERAVAAPVAPAPPAPVPPPPAPAAPAEQPRAAATAPAPAAQASADDAPTRTARNPRSISWEIAPENAPSRPPRQTAAAKADKPTASEKPARPEKAAPTEKPVRPEKAAPTEKPARPDKSARTDDGDKAERPTKAAPADRADRAPASPRAPGAPTPMDKW
jgi:serine/threonine protein kinase